MSQKKNEGILFPTEIRVVGSYTDRLLSVGKIVEHILIHCWTEHRSLRTSNPLAEIWYVFFLIPGAGPILRVLNNREMKVLPLHCNRLDLRVAWMTT